MRSLVTASRMLLAHQAFLADALAGLQSVPKTLPCKYFYDERGSQLFERICQLDEYYLTRCELAITDEFASEMGTAIGPGAMLVEFGSGASVKTRYLLDGLPDPVAYVPVDISGDFLSHTASELASDYPEIEVLPVNADFTRDFALPVAQRAPTHVAVYFPGSTIGNFLPDRASALLRRIAHLCGSGGGLLIGIDLKKDIGRIEAAYNDALGVTAQFNLNLLARLNRELGADFDLDQFEHRATYKTDLGRVEMHLVSRDRQVASLGGTEIAFARGETICTEYSHKYSVPEFARLAANAGFVLRREWTDNERNFAVLHLVVS